MQEALPLMPGFEPVLEVPPEPPKAAVSTPNGALSGCDCAGCNNLRAQYTASLLAETQRRITPPSFNWDQPDPNAGRIRGRYEGFNSGLEGQVRWREPGELRAYSAEGRAQWTFARELADGTLVGGLGHRWVPDAPTSTRVRGRYTADTQANASMAGGIRWLDTATLELFESESDTIRSNSGMERRTDGTYRSRAGTIWESV